MTKKLALLSGKGGSGKTSLSLCIANLLSSCGIKTLLVDCDLSTNGATYFFEDYLNADGSFCSIWSLCQSKGTPQLKDKKEIIASIKDNFDFIPSVSKIDGSIIEKSNESFFSYSIFDKIVDSYDAVIFDCQAGYSFILQGLLPHVDETLFVMEADAISSSSIRSLHLKIGSFLSRKSYQVFNKVSLEEYKIYNKVSGGTLFTNIESIMFDWTIRKAFALSQIPSIENVSFHFYEQILKICKVLFGENTYLDKIDAFSKIITRKKILEEKRELFEILNETKAQAKTSRIKLFSTLSITYALLAFIFVYITFIKDPLGLNWSEIVAILCSILVFITSFLARKVYNRGDSIANIQQRIEDLDFEAQKLGITDIIRPSTLKIKL